MDVCVYLGTFDANGKYASFTLVCRNKYFPIGCFTSLPTEVCPSVLKAFSMHVGT